MSASHGTGYRQEQQPTGRTDARIRPTGHLRVVLAKQPDLREYNII